MKFQHYKVTPEIVWNGRIDDPNDPDSYRMHQVIQILNLNAPLNLAQNGRIKIALLGFCCDEGVKRNLGRPGAAKGPEKIRQEFANLPVTFYQQADLYDAGDLLCPDHQLEAAQGQLAQAVSILLDNQLFPILLGGGHEMALGHFNGIVKHFDHNQQPLKAPGIINFDAHLDLRPYDKGGSSGSMFYQIADKCHSENRDFNYLCLGTQTYANTISLFKRAEQLGAQYIHAKDLIPANYPDILGTLYNFMDVSESVQLTICCDVFNSASAPGVSALQPFGLEPDLVLKMLKQILKTNRVMGLDIAEVSPRFDHDNQTAKLAAIIVYAAINALVENQHKNN